MNTGYLLEEITFALNSLEEIDTAQLNEHYAHSLVYAEDSISKIRKILQEYHYAVAAIPNN